MANTIFFKLRKTIKTNNFTNCIICCLLNIFIIYKLKNKYLSFCHRKQKRKLEIYQDNPCFSTLLNSKHHQVWQTTVITEDLVQGEGRIQINGENHPISFYFKFLMYILML